MYSFLSPAPFTCLDISMLMYNKHSGNFGSSPIWSLCMLLWAIRGQRCYHCWYRAIRLPLPSFPGLLLIRRHPRDCHPCCHPRCAGLHRWVSFSFLSPPSSASSLKGLFVYSPYRVDHSSQALRVEIQLPNQPQPRATCPRGGQYSWFFLPDISHLWQPHAKRRSW